MSGFVSGRIQCAGYFGHAGLATVDGNFAGDIAQCFRFYNTCILYHGVDGRGGIAGRHQDHAAVRFDCSRVDGAGFHRRLVHSQVDLAVPFQVQGKSITCGQGRGTGFRVDGAVVFHFVGQESHNAAFGVNLGIIDHLLRGRTGEDVLAVHEIIIRNVLRGGYQGAHVNLGTGAESNAGRVDQENLAPGVQGTVNLGHVPIIHTVQGRHGRVLFKVHGFLAGNIKVSPVQYRFLAGLGNIHGLSGYRDIRGPFGHHPALGQRVGMGTG